MCDFSFAITSYNQEEYIIQLLESIKYQIEAYGTGKAVQLVIGDDCSRDRTVNFVQEWISQNEGLFCDVQVIARPQNIGTIRNMEDVSAHCLSDRIFIIAGDDLIYKNDLISKVGEKDVILSPTVEFDDEGKINSDIMEEFIELFRYKDRDDLKNHIRKMLDYRQCLASPGVLLAIDIWNDSVFLDYVKDYKFIEDIFEWYYLFNKYPKEYSIEIESRPYIMYRTNSGVSESLGRKKDNPVELEFKEIRKRIPCKEDFLPKYINPFKYMHAIKTKLIYRSWKKDPKVGNELANWGENISGAKEYLQLIKERADEFYKKV